MIVNDLGVGGHVQELSANLVGPMLPSVVDAVNSVARVSHEIAAIGATVANAQANLLAATNTAHRLAAMTTPGVSTALSRFNRLASAHQAFAGIGAQIAQRYAFPALSPMLRFDAFGSIAEAMGARNTQLIGHPSAPDEILDIIERLAELRVLPRLRGLTRRASRLVFDFYDAIRVRAQEAVERHVGPVAVPRGYLQEQATPGRGRRVQVISPHRQVEHSIGHLQIRAPGSDDIFRRPTPPSLNGDPPCSALTTTNTLLRRAPRSRSASAPSCHRSRQALLFLDPRPGD